MAEALDRDQLLAASSTPIAQLQPELSDLNSRTTEGTVTITWPYSIITKSVAFVLAERDPRLRRDGGQMRIEFQGISAKVLSDAGIGGGDEIRLSLAGAQWEKSEVQRGLPAGSSAWQIKFRSKARFLLHQLGADEPRYFDIDGPGDTDQQVPPILTADGDSHRDPETTRVAPPSTRSPSPPLTARATKRLASATLDPEEFASPAFLKRARVSYGSLFEGGIDSLDGGDRKKGVKRKRPSRFSMGGTVWRYSSRSPSPESEEASYAEDVAERSTDDIENIGAAARSPEATPSRQTMVDEGCQTKDLAPGSTADDQLTIGDRPTARALFGSNAVPTAHRSEPLTEHSPRLTTTVTNAHAGPEHQSFAVFGSHSGDEMSNPFAINQNYDLGALHGDTAIGNTLPVTYGADLPPETTEAPTTTAHDQPMGAFPVPTGFSHDFLPRDPEFVSSEPYPSLSSEPQQANGTTMAEEPLPAHLPSEVPLTFQHPLFTPAATSGPELAQASGTAANAVEIWDTSSPPREYQMTVDQEAEPVLSEAELPFSKGSFSQGEDHPLNPTAPSDGDGERDYQDGGDIAGEDYDLRNYAHTNQDDQSESESSVADAPSEGDVMNPEEELIDESDEEEEYEEGYDPEEAPEDDHDSHCQSEQLHDYDDDGEGYAEEELHDEEYADEDGELAAASEPATQPVFISLLSDSEDEDEGEDMPSPQASPAPDSDQPEIDVTESMGDDRPIAPIGMEVEQVEHIAISQTEDDHGVHEVAESEHIELDQAGKQALITHETTLSHRVAEPGESTDNRGEIEADAPHHETSEASEDHGTAAAASNVTIEDRKDQPNVKRAKDGLDDDIPEEQTQHSELATLQHAVDDSTADQVERSTVSQDSTQPKLNEQLTAAERRVSPPVTQITEDGSSQLLQTKASGAPWTSSQDQTQLPTPSETQPSVSKASGPAIQPDDIETAESMESPNPEDQLKAEAQAAKPEFHDAVQETGDKEASIRSDHGDTAEKQDVPAKSAEAAEVEPLITVHSLRSHDHEKEPLITVHSLRSHDYEREKESDYEALPIDGTSASSTRPAAELFTTEAPEASKPPTLRISRRKKGHLDPSIQLTRSAKPPTKAKHRQASSEAKKHTRKASQTSQRQITPENMVESVQSPSIVSSSPADERLAPQKSRLLEQLRDTLPDYLPLKSLRSSVHKTADFLAIATKDPSEPHRPKNGPRDYMLELLLTDPSIAPSKVIVTQIYRPHKTSLPTVHAGDVVLLRRFEVLSMAGRDFGLRTLDASSWAVYEKDDEERLAQIKGPPVEITNEEFSYAEQLRQWWDELGPQVTGKVEKANNRMLQATKDITKQ